jgi:hypothetical protein
MPVLTGMYVDASLGASSFVALSPAADGGCRYNIVNVSLLGSGSMRNSGMTNSDRRRTERKANDPIAAQGFRTRGSIR